jgi:hypothetical protein
LIVWDCDGYDIMIDKSFLLVDIRNKITLSRMMDVLCRYYWNDSFLYCEFMIWSETSWLIHIVCYFVATLR